MIILKNWCHQGANRDRKSARHEPRVVECSERRGPTDRAAAIFPRLGHRDQAFALGLFAGRLASASDRLGFLAGLALGWLFIGLATLHLAKDALPLHLLLQNPEGLIDIVIANEYLQMFSNRAVAALMSDSDSAQ